MVRTLWPGLSGVSDGVPSTVSLHVRPIVLWREDNVICECSYASSVWTLRLMVGGTPARERTHSGVTAMLETARIWRDTVEKVPARVTDRPVARIGPDRRTLPAERRAVMRGGRRHSDAQAPDLNVPLLLTEVGHLREENELLRNAALTFGALAERLSLRAKSNTGEHEPGAEA
jgi:hypothetical protein